MLGGPSGQCKSQGPYLFSKQLPFSGSINRCWTKQPNSPASYPAAPWQPQPLNMLCSSTSQRHLAEPCQCCSAMSRFGRCTFVALSPLPVEVADQVGQIWMAEDGEGRWVQPWSPTWQHLLPCLLCQCDRRHTHTCRDQQRKAGKCGIWGFHLEDYLSLMCDTAVLFITSMYSSADKWQNTQLN